MQIRPTTDADMPHLETIATAMGVPSGRDDFPRCFEEQRAGRRRIFLAVDGESPLGYVQLNFTPVYQPFRRLGLAEIQDLNVVPAARRQGLGEQLVIVCEDFMRAQGATDIGISVGVVASFGAAQRLYARRGYVPDGAGLCFDDEPVRSGTMLPISDLMTLKLVRAL